MVQVAISESARDDLTDLPDDVQDRIKEKFTNEVAHDVDRHLRSLSNSEFQSVRIGDYRAVVNHVPDADQLRILAVGHRSTIYDRELDG